MDAPKQWKDTTIFFVERVIVTVNLQQLSFGRDPSMATLSKQKVNFKSNVLGEYAINLKIFGGNEKKTALGTCAEACR